MNDINRLTEQILDEIIKKHDSGVGEVKVEVAQDEAEKIIMCDGFIDKKILVKSDLTEDRECGILDITTRVRLPNSGSIIETNYSFPAFMDLRDYFKAIRNVFVIANEPFRICKNPKVYDELNKNRYFMVMETVPGTGISIYKEMVTKNTKQLIYPKMSFYTIIDCDFSDNTVDAVSMLTVYGYIEDLLDIMKQVDSCSRMLEFEDKHSERNIMLGDVEEILYSESNVNKFKVGSRDDLYSIWSIKGLDNYGVEQRIVTDDFEEITGNEKSKLLFLNNMQQVIDEDNIFLPSARIYF